MQSRILDLKRELDGFLKKTADPLLGHWQKDFEPT
jgi:hypothetical protein